MMLDPLDGHGAPKLPRDPSRDPRGCPAEGNDDARETLRTQWFGGQAPLKPLVFLGFCTCAHEAKIGPRQRRAKRYVHYGFVDMGAFLKPCHD